MNVLKDVHEAHKRCWKFRRLYYGVMDRSGNYPMSLHEKPKSAKTQTKRLNEMTNGYSNFWQGCSKEKPRFWVKRFELVFNGNSVDMYEHEYQRKEKKTTLKD